MHSDHPAASPRTKNGVQGTRAICFILIFVFAVITSSIALNFSSVALTSARIENGIFNFQNAVPLHPTNSPSIQDTAASTTTQPGTSYWYVGASTTDSSLNAGVRSYIEVRSQQNSVGVISFWISEAFQNNLWAQVGYYIQNGSAPVAFYQIWSLTNRTEISTGTHSVSDGFHEFSIVYSTGTTWKFTLDSHVFGTYDIGTNNSATNYPIYAMSEEGYVTAPFAFSEVVFTRAIQISGAGSWINAASATSFGNSWGIKGNAQSSQLLANELVIGGSIPTVAPNGELWSA